MPAVGVVVAVAAVVRPLVLGSLREALVHVALPILAVRRQVQEQMPTRVRPLTGPT